MEPPRVLFVCGRNQWRSPTAEAVYRNDPRVQVRSAGVSEQSRRRLSARDLDWADLILVMERRHQARIRERFPDHPALGRIHSLDIPDEYEFMEPQLVGLLKLAVDPHLEHLLQDSQTTPSP
jgi:predicted protein tyrosine phosphatase